MQFDSETIDGILIVAPPKMDIDAGNADEFKKDAASAIQGHNNVIMDMSNINFMDSAGLGAMLSVFKKVRAEGGRFRIFGLVGEVKALFQLVRMQRLFEIHDDKETAVATAKS